MKIIRSSFLNTTMSDQSITLMLQRIKAGEKHLLKDVYASLYEEIKNVAKHQIAKLNTGQTITPTVLAHDCYLKVVKQKYVNAENHQHFLNCLSISMRQLLIDIYRKKSSLKQQHITVSMDYGEITGDQDINFKILELDRLLNQVMKLNSQYSEVLNYKLILSMTFAEIAEVINKSERQVVTLWNQAKTLLVALSKGANTDVKRTD